MLKYCYFYRNIIDSERQEGMGILKVHITKKQFTSQDWDAYSYEGSFVHD